MGSETRRDFLKSSTLAAAGFWVASRDAWAQSRSPNGRLQVACIGVGGKGKVDAAGAADAGADIVALCDVDDVRGKDSYERFPKARRFGDYRRMLDEMHASIDAVIVSTPDHMHAAQTMMAMKLGKHVYTQKPLTHDVYEARLLRDTARERRIVSQMGNQGTASDTFREAIEVIQSGAIGAVREVHVWTNRPIWPQGAQAIIQNRAVRSALRGEKAREAVPSTLQWDLWLGCAPLRPYDEVYVPFSWRGWWDFGTGALGDMACHLINLPYHALKLGYPTAIEAQTAPDLNDETYPSWSVVRYEFPAREGLPPVELTWYDGGKNRPDWVGQRLTQAAQSKTVAGNGSIFVGEKGTLVCAHETGSRYHLVPEERFRGFKPPEPTLPRVPGHYREWVRACLENNPRMPMSNFDTAGPMTETVLLGCVAMRAGGRIEWDAAASKITNLPEANRYLRREYREGWTL